MARIFKPTPAKRRREDTPVTLTIDSLAGDGRGVARHSGKVVFVEGGLPGEQVSVAHYRRHKRFSECQAKAVLTASEDRQQPACPHFVRCGGCQLQHLAVSRQAEVKQAALLDLLARQHQLQPAEVLPPLASGGLGYRARVRLVVDGQGQLCLREKASDRLVAVHSCPVLVAPLQALLEVIRTWLQLPGCAAAVTHVELVDAEPRPGLLIRHQRPLPVAAVSAFSDLQQHSAVYLQAEKGGALCGPDLAVRKTNLQYSLPPWQVNLQFLPTDFTQINREINLGMIEQALSWLDPDESSRVADLFCGIGNFSLPLARRAGQVLALEVAPEMVARAADNASRNGIGNVTFRALDLEQGALAQHLQEFGCDKLLLDPPRAGARFVCEQLRDAAVKSLVYVSCNPASFARDAALLVEAGFVLRSLRTLDMFPQTAHLEVMALFSRQGKG